MPISYPHSDGAHLNSLSKNSLLLGFLLVFSLLGCKEEVDDQTLAKGITWKAVNPMPVIRNFLENNLKHQVIVAAIDSGTDYNHPELLNSIHFTLNESNQPIGFGYDFVGEDHWPSPYVARTLDTNPDADQKDALPTRNAREHTTQISKSNPKLAELLNPLRNVEQETESKAYHGTHVSGLLVYNDPRIGLLSYRVLPVNVKYKNGRKDTSVDQTGIAFGHILSAMSLAVKGGARVINMSLALKDASQDSLFGLGGLLNDKVRIKNWMNQVKIFMDKNPQVVFVAAAGNESKWVDDKTNLQLPCGIGARNLVCVGALDNDGNLAYFSNLVLSQSAFVATNGVDIVSTRPIGMCESTFYYSLKNSKNQYPFDSAEALDRSLELYRADCVGKTPMRKASGTSMSSPIVARVVAKLIIENPELSGQEIIKKLVDQADKVQLGPLLLNRVKFEKPSWDKKI